MTSISDHYSPLWLPSSFSHHSHTVSLIQCCVVNRNDGYNPLSRNERLRRPSTCQLHRQSSFCLRYVSTLPPDVWIGGVGSRQGPLPGMTVCVFRYPLFLCVFLALRSSFRRRSLLRMLRIHWLTTSPYTCLLYVQTVNQFLAFLTFFLLIV